MRSRVLVEQYYYVEVSLHLHHEKIRIQLLSIHCSIYPINDIDMYMKVDIRL